MEVGRWDLAQIEEDFNGLVRIEGRGRGLAMGGLWRCWKLLGVLSSGVGDPAGIPAACDFEAENH
jgi:hypothetical protein